MIADSSLPIRGIVEAHLRLPWNAIQDVPELKRIADLAVKLWNGEDEAHSHFGELIGIAARDGSIWKEKVEAIYLAVTRLEDRLQASGLKRDQPYYVVRHTRFHGIPVRIGELEATSLEGAFFWKRRMTEDESFQDGSDTFAIIPTAWILGSPIGNSEKILIADGVEELEDFVLHSAIYDDIPPAPAASTGNVYHALSFDAERTLIVVQNGRITAASDWRLIGLEETDPLVFVLCGTRGFNLLGTFGDEE